MDSEDCDIVLIKYKKYEDGEVVYFNPLTNKVCNGENDTEKYHRDNSATNYTGTSFEGFDDAGDKYYTDMTENQNGCMLWHAFLDTEEASVVRLILDHNTTERVAWNADGGDTPVTALAKLAGDIAGWDDNVKGTARFIKGAEITAIATEYAKTATNYGTAYQIWDVNNSATLYRFTTGEKYTSYNGTANGPHELAWLYNNLNSCNNYGCEFTSWMGNYYWTADVVGTSDSSDSISAWAVCYDRIDSQPVTDPLWSGIRPVIEVPKSILENK